MSKKHVGETSIPKDQSNSVWGWYL